MSTPEIMALAIGLTTALVQVLKKLKALDKVTDYIEVVAILIGIGMFYGLARAKNLDVSNLWDIGITGLMVGLASIGVYQTGNALPGTNKILN